ncbi:hypothetical protein CF168_03515 [Shewanella bicestrii]|uniref:Uncharacterized protein n=1 Tax=Shewanella bicestrii TaxID=2018305 RepID=A0A220UIJ5_9GAMM|nr:hypothetical protein [Shewanella bicestrii]ASK68008.1 hypothetical protein CF168_03515 [Shewanella bicestrii]
MLNFAAPDNGTLVPVPDDALRWLARCGGCQESWEQYPSQTNQDSFVGIVTAVISVSNFYTDICKSLPDIDISFVYCAELTLYTDCTIFPPARYKLAPIGIDGHPDSDEKILKA